MARRDELLVDNRTDIKTLCHADIVDVLYFGHSLGYSHSFGCQASQDVCFRTSRQSYKRFGVLDTFFGKQLNVSSVAVDNHYVIVYQFRQAVAAVDIVFYNLSTHILR